MMYKSKSIQIMSFGYKYGIPAEANLVQDVRFLPNPFYIEDLKEKTGICKEVQSYVKNSQNTTQYLAVLKDFLSTYIRLYLDTDKDTLVIAIGCTGGRHRSVTVAEDVYEYLKALGCSVSICHRDIKKGD